MSGGLAALLDDIAALARVAAASIDDVSAAASRAGTKAAGVIVDDAAVTPRYVTGFKPERELPIMKKIAIGSLRNKLLFIVPVALLLSQFVPWVLTPLLMLGGLYLSFEGAEKLLEKMGVLQPHAEQDVPVIEQGEQRKEMVTGRSDRPHPLRRIMVIALNESPTSRSSGARSSWSSSPSRSRCSSMASSPSSSRTTSGSSPAHLGTAQKIGRAPGPAASSLRSSV